MLLLVRVCRIGCRHSCGTPVAYRPSTLHLTHSLDRPLRSAAPSAKRLQDALSMPLMAPRMDTSLFTPYPQARLQFCHRHPCGSRSRPRCWEFCCCWRPLSPRDSSDLGCRLRTTRLDAPRPLLLTVAAAAEHARRALMIDPHQRLTFSPWSRPSSEFAASSDIQG
jgi:hypothetical protein